PKNTLNMAANNLLMGRDNLLCDRCGGHPNAPTRAAALLHCRRSEPSSRKGTAMADTTTPRAAHLSPMPVGRDTGGPEIAWRPSPDYLERSRLRRFMAA